MKPRKTKKDRNNHSKLKKKPDDQKTVKTIKNLKTSISSRVRRLSDLYTFYYVRKKYSLLLKMGGFTTISEAIVTGVLYKTRHFLNEKALYLLFNSLLMSNIRYGLLRWGRSNKKCINNINVLINRAIRCIYEI